MIRSIWLFVFVMCLVSCGNSPFSRNPEPPIANPQELPTAVASEQLPTPAPTATLEPSPMPSATPQAPLGPDVNALLSDAMSMMANVGTFHFAMERQFFSEYETGVLSVRTPVRGKFNAPDQIQGSIVLSANGKSAILDFIIIGEELYLREENSDSWQRLDWQSRAAQIVRENAFLPLEQLSPDNLHDPVLLGEARLSGLPVYHVRGALGKLAEGQSNPGENAIEFWIGKENNYIYRVISETVDEDPDELAINSRSKIQVDYANFGEPVLIVAPQVDTSGGYRPTGSYSADELLKNYPSGLNDGAADALIDSTGPAMDEASSIDQITTAQENALD